MNSPHQLTDHGLSPMALCISPYKRFWSWVHYRFYYRPLTLIHIGFTHLEVIMCCTQSASWSQYISRYSDKFLYWINANTVCIIIFSRYLHHLKYFLWYFFKITVEPSMEKHWKYNWNKHYLDILLLLSYLKQASNKKPSLNLHSGYRALLSDHFLLCSFT